jgi:hypothetical protein
MTETQTLALSNADLEAAHRRSIRNRLAGRCGCFYCLATFMAERVTDWADDGETALCPVCGIDAVLSSTADPVSPAVLAQMHERWFGSSVAVAAGELREPPT